MRLTDLIAGLGVRCVAGDVATTIVDLTDDSRCIEPGWLFVARSGVSGDAAVYTSQAIERGAVVVISENEPPATLPKHVAWCVADRVDQRLAGQLAERFFGHPSEKLALIGITGTNGKTTTAFLVQHLLHAAGCRCGLIGTVVIDDGATRQPAELTTPGAIEMSRLLARMVANGCRAAAVEVSSHALHQGRTAALRFAVGVFTNLTGDHLDYHGTMEDYAAAKALLFEQLPEQGWAVVNDDDAFGPVMLERCRAHVLRCSMKAEEASDNICHATVLSLEADHSVARFDGPWGSVEARLPLVGRHNVFNVLQALAAANAVKSMSKRLRGALSSAPPVPGRLEPVRVEEADHAALPTVLVDYAHTHDALENVLLALRPVVKGRLIVVFGCGGDRDRSKRPKMAQVACKLADRVIITSDNPRTENPATIIRDILAGVSEPADDRVTVEIDRAKAIALAVEQADADDTVLLAGKGHEDYQIVACADAPGGVVKRHFDDREHAAEALRRRAQSRANVRG